MEFTGERVVPDKVEPDLFNEHLSRYFFARDFATSRRVLDLGCGTGYGSAIAYAREKYSRPGIHYLVANCNQLPVGSGSQDLVVCFEVVEHLSEQERLLDEISRVLNPDGILVISTPNRLFYTEERQEINPYHTHEFDYQEFLSYLRRCFEEVEICFQNHVSSIFLGNPEVHNELDAHVQGLDPNLKTVSNFFLAVCAKTTGHLPKYHNLLFVPSTANLLREKELWIGQLESRIHGLDKNILRLQKEYDQQVEESAAWALKLETELHEFQDRTAFLEQELLEKNEHIVKLQKEFDERTEWALRLDKELGSCQAKLERLKQSKLFRFSKVLGLVPKI
jgi:SAM-dependent methyltransferase